MAIIGGAALYSRGAHGVVLKSTSVSLTLGVASGAAPGGRISIVLGFSIIPEITIAAGTFFFHWQSLQSS